MKKYIHKAFKHPLISGSAVLFVGSMVTNVINFLFNIFMGRNLSLADYGTLVSLSSVILLCALIAESFIPTVVSFAGAFFAKDEYASAKALYLKLIKFSGSIGLFFLLVFTLFSVPIAKFFNIQQSGLFIIVGVIVLFSFLYPINRAFLQAKLEFGFISLVAGVGSALKLLIGVVLVLAGFKIFGAMGAFLFSFFIPYALSFYPIRFIFALKKSPTGLSIGKLISYGAPAAVALSATTFFISTDVLMVKHFFSPQQAGLYASLSLIGKVVFYFSSPVGMAMFPLIVQKHAREEEYDGIFKLSLLLVFLASLSIAVFYFIYPDFTFHLFFKKQDIGGLGSLLGLFGIFIAFYSMLYIMVNFFLSVKKTKVAFVVLAFAGIQAIFINFFHSNFYQVLYISILSTSLPFFILLIYYLHLYGKRTTK